MEEYGQWDSTIFLVIIWLMGIFNLFINVSQFELMVDIGIVVIVLALSTIFYKKKSKEEIV